MTPPIRNTPPVPSSHPKEQLAVEKIDNLFPALQFYEQQISFNKKISEAKIKELSNYKMTAILFLSRLHELGILINFLKDFSPSFAKRFPLSQEEYDRLETKLLDQISSLEKEYEGFESKYLTNLIQDKQVDQSDFLFGIEATGTNFINKLAYKHEVETFIETHKEIILKEFYGARSAEIDLKSLVAKPNFASNETHNSGKSPVFITFEYEGKELFQVVYKPRDAAVDKNVMETFEKINALERKEKSVDVRLPHYKILNFPTDNASVWEYIDGQDVNERNVSMFISEKLRGERLEKTRMSLNRLDAILTRMGISDLHKENFKVKYLSAKDREVEIIPIDLENLQIGHPTMIGAEPSKVTLTAQEESVIKNYFDSKVDVTPYRYLPLTTNYMGRLIMDHRNYETLARSVIERLRGDKFTLKTDLEVLKGLIFRSMLANDVPYFTQFKGVVYYGLPSEGQPIAEKGG